MTVSDSFWFSDVDREAREPYIWQPCLETGAGHVPCFEVWFSTKQECEDWIREYVIGAGLEADQADELAEHDPRAEKL